MIINDGVNIYLQEVENLLIGHPDVADVALVGVPDEEVGEAVKAAVQRVPGGDPDAVVAERWIAFCRNRLSPVKRPRSVDFRDELPRHPNGKHYKRLLKDEYWSGHRSRILRPAHSGPGPRPVHDRSEPMTLTKLTHDQIDVLSLAFWGPRGRGAGESVQCAAQDVFPDPYSFDFTRPPNDHVAFGGGGSHQLPDLRSGNPRTR